MKLLSLAAVALLACGSSSPQSTDARSSDASDDTWTRSSDDASSSSSDASDDTWIRSSDASDDTRTRSSDASDDTWTRSSDASPSDAPSGDAGQCTPLTYPIAGPSAYGCADLTSPGYWYVQPAGAGGYQCFVRTLDPDSGLTCAECRQTFTCACLEPFVAGGLHCADGTADGGETAPIFY